MAKVYYNEWHIGIYFTPINAFTPMCLGGYQIKESAISGEMQKWIESGFVEDEFASEPDRRYLDKWVAGRGGYSIIADLIECEEDIPSIFEEDYL